MERLAGYDFMTVCRIGAIFHLVFGATVWETSRWSFPLFLVGIVAHEVNGYVAFREFTRIVFASLINDVFQTFFSMSSGLWSLLLNLIALGLKFTLYFCAKRVLIEKGGPEMNGLASLDPRQAMRQIQAGAGGWGRGGATGGGQQLGTAEAGQTIFSMPGGLSSTPPPYANEAPAAHNSNTGRFPGSGFTLGTEDDANEQGHIPGNGNQTGRGGYRAVP